MNPQSEFRQSITVKKEAAIQEQDFEQAAYWRFIETVLDKPNRLNEIDQRLARLERQFGRSCEDSYATALQQQRALAEQADQ